MPEGYGPVRNDWVFPRPLGDNGYVTGLELRDYFAAQAMESLIDRDITSKRYALHASDFDCDRIARSAYAIADAMLLMRAEPRP